MASRLHSNKTTLPKADPRLVGPIVRESVEPNPPRYGGYGSMNRLRESEVRSRKDRKRAKANRRASEYADRMDAAERESLAITLADFSENEKRRIASKDLEWFRVQRKLGNRISLPRYLAARRMIIE